MIFLRRLKVEHSYRRITIWVLFGFEFQSIQLCMWYDPLFVQWTWYVSWCRPGGANGIVVVKADGTSQQTSLGMRSSIPKSDQDSSPVLHERRDRTTNPDKERANTRAVNKYVNHPRRKYLLLLIVHIRTTHFANCFWILYSHKLLGCFSFPDPFTFPRSHIYIFFIFNIVTSVCILCSFFFLYHQDKYPGRIQFS